MPSSRRTAAARPDPRGPLIFDIRTLSRRPGSMRAERRSVPAPAGLSTPMAAVPVGAGIDLDVQFESVTEGVLVTATAMAPVRAECARCLEPVEQTVQVRCQELFSYQRPDSADEEGYPLQGDLLDFEPALRDALVLSLPLAPLCADSCPGLCPECGVPLAQADQTHDHEHIDPRWESLRALAAQAGPDGPVSPAPPTEEGRGRGPR